MMFARSSGRDGFNLVPPPPVAPKQSVPPPPNPPAPKSERVAFGMLAVTSGRTGFAHNQRMPYSFSNSGSTLSDSSGFDSIPNTVVHEGVFCDDCKRYPIQGTRYRCLQCPDFDLCDSCEAKNNHPHILLKIPDSSPLRHAALLQNRQHLVHTMSCNFCQQPIRGLRYLCTECGVNICEMCDFAGNHPATHTVLRYGKAQSQ
jgi:hypothetical protein